MKKKVWIVPLILSVSIAFIALVFHYPVHIENALTLNPEPDFIIQVSWLRIIFEPVLGVLLYLNRSFYAIKELVNTLYWLALLFAFYTIIKCLIIKEKEKVKKFLLLQLANLFILAGICFAILVVIFFIPLHNDRIINKTSDWVLVGTHSHTEFSHDGLISQDGLLKWHMRNGFDAFFITDHNNHKQTLEFVNMRRNREKPGEPVVFCGEEFSGSNHLSLLGLKTSFKTKGFSDSEAVAKARADGAAIIVNHWFDGENKSLDYYRDLGIDGYEIENTAKDKRYNREVYLRIKTFSQNNGLIMNGGLDFHGYGIPCTIWNAFEIKGWKKMDFAAQEEAILNIIKNREQSKLKVLLLNDRPYYEKKNLFLQTIKTVLNYFRTLNPLQVLSWFFWIFILSLIYGIVNTIPAWKEKFACRKVLPLAGLAASIFLIGLGVVYVVQNQAVEDFTEIYPVYYKILFLSGSAILIVSGITAYFRIFRK